MKKKKMTTALRIHIATNAVLGALVLSVGALCLAPLGASVTTDGETAELYRSAGEDSKGVSLMFNVYWGTNEVYEILNVLKKHEARATFFIGGCWADDNVTCLKAIAEAGHEVGNHGYFHKAHENMSLSQNKKEISDCSRFIELAIGAKPVLFAPPSGAYNEATLTACSELKMKTILWSKDTIDWRDKDASLIYTRATKNIKKGDFVLMHPMEATVKALDDILKYYDTQSLSVVTVSENLLKEGKRNGIRKTV